MPHTTGPWASSSYCGGETGIYPEGEGSGRDIALVRLSDDHAGNVALIAAAPAMLDALRDLAEYLDFGTVGGCGFSNAGAIERALEAISAATGGEG